MVWYFSTILNPISGAAGVAIISILNELAFIFKIGSKVKVVYVKALPTRYSTTR